MHVFVNKTYSMECRLAEISRCFKNCFGCRWNKFLKTTLPRKTSPRIKTPYPKLMILVSFYSKRIFYPMKQQSAMTFCQRYCWNYTSQVLHSFWATLYRPTMILPNNLAQNLRVYEFRCLHNIYKHSVGGQCSPSNDNNQYWISKWLMCNNNNNNNN